MTMLIRRAAERGPADHAWLDRNAQIEYVLRNALTRAGRAPTQRKKTA